MLTYKTVNPKKAFTIIEIIVAIAVISMLVGLSYTGYAAFTQRQELTSDGQNLKNILRDVQSRSFNGEVDCNTCNCSDPTKPILDGWFVDLSSRQFYGQCKGIRFSLTSLKISADAVLTANNNLIQFVSDPPRASRNTAICMSYTGLPNKYYRIAVTRSGDISDSGGLIAVCTL